MKQRGGSRPTTASSTNECCERTVLKRHLSYEEPRTNMAGIYRQSPVVPRQQPAVRGFAQSRSVDLIRQRSVGQQQQQRKSVARRTIERSYTNNTNSCETRYRAQEDRRCYSRWEEQEPTDEKIFLQTFQMVAESLRRIEANLASINNTMIMVNETLAKQELVRATIIKTPTSRRQQDNGLQSRSSALLESTNTYTESSNPYGDSACLAGLNDSLSLSVSQVDCTGHLLDDLSAGRPISPKLFVDSAGQYGLDPIEEGRSSQSDSHSARSNIGIPYVTN